MDSREKARLTEKMNTFGADSALTDEEFEDALDAAEDIYRAVLNTVLDEVERLYLELSDLERTYKMAQSMGKASNWFYAIQGYANTTDTLFIQALAPRARTSLDDAFAEINADFREMLAGRE